jgi:hypothetical protein
MICGGCVNVMENERVTIRYMKKRRKEEKKKRIHKGKQ